MTSSDTNSSGMMGGDVAAIAAKLTVAQRAYLTRYAKWVAPAIGHEPRWMTFPPANTLAVLCHRGLTDRAGQLREIGIAVRDHLLARSIP